MPYQADIENLKAKSLHRFLRPVESPQGPRIRIDGAEVLNFASNDYLGLAFDAALVRAAVEALERWGTGSGASRLLSGSLGIHHELERKTAEFKGEEAALVFSSGYAANLGVITALAAKADSVWIDRFCHASIIDAARLSGKRLRVYPHRDAGFLDARLRAGKERALIVTESYFSMDGDRAPLGDLAKIARRRGATLVVDEAHACGVMGPDGRGLADPGLGEEAGAVVGTFSKAFGSHGGFAAASATTMDFLVNTARSFIYSTAPSPAASGASLAALEISQNDASRRERLWSNVRFLRALLGGAGFDLMGSEGPIIPVLVKNTATALGWSRGLLEKGIYAPAIRPPTVPKGTDRIRITVTAAHTKEDLERLAAALKEVRG